MFFNLAFTSLPVILMGFLDQDVEDRISLAVPQLYQRGILRRDWTQTKFWLYMIDGLYQSLISFFFPFLTHLGGVYISESGKSLDHRFWMGITVCTIAVISCNFYIISNQYRWDIVSVIVAGISSLLVWVWTGIFSSFVGSRELYKVADHLYRSASFWAVLFAGVIAALLPHYCTMAVQKMFFPRDIDIIREQMSQGLFDNIPPISEENDGLHSAMILEKSMNSRLLNLHGNGASANNNAGGKQVLSDEEASDNTFHEAEMHSSSSSGSIKKKRPASFTKRLSSIHGPSSGKHKHQESKAKTESDEESLVSPSGATSAVIEGGTSILGLSTDSLQQPLPTSAPGTGAGSFIGGGFENSLYTASSNDLANMSPVPSSMTGEPLAYRPSRPTTGSGDIALLRVPTSHPLQPNASTQSLQPLSSSASHGDGEFKYRRCEYPKDNAGEVDMDQIRQSLEIARGNIRNEQAPRGSFDVVRISCDIGDELTTAEGLMRSYSRQKVDDKDDGVPPYDDDEDDKDEKGKKKNKGGRTQGPKRQHSILQKLFHKQEKPEN